jgi:hypothetical protein
MRGLESWHSGCRSCRKSILGWQDSEGEDSGSTTVKVWREGKGEGKGEGGKARQSIMNNGEGNQTRGNRLFHRIVIGKVL